MRTCRTIPFYASKACGSVFPVTLLCDERHVATTRGSWQGQHTSISLATLSASSAAGGPCGIVDVIRRLRIGGLADWGQ
jgi:hypothetical protein